MQLQFSSSTLLYIYVLTLTVNFSLSVSPQEGYGDRVVLACLIPSCFFPDGQV